MLNIARDLVSFYSEELDVIIILSSHGTVNS